MPVDKLAKIRYIDWLLSHFLHPNPSVNYLLVFIKSQSTLLNLVAFSEAAKTAPRGIYIAFNNHSDHNFRYYKDQRIYTDCEQAFHDLRLNQRKEEHTVYIEIDNEHARDQMLYLNVFEENPYFHGSSFNAQAFNQQLDVFSQQVNLQRLLSEMNLALDQGDREKFEVLSAQWETIKRTKP